MIANTDTPEIDKHGNLRRKFISRLLTIGGLGGLGILFGKLMPPKAHAKVDGKYVNSMPNVKTSFNHHLAYPDVNPTAYVHPLASVIGNIYLGKRVMVSPCSSIRGDEGTPIYVGDGSNVQDCCVIHALETMEGGHEETSHTVQSKGADSHKEQSHEADNTNAAGSHGGKTERIAANEPVSHETESLGQNTGRADYQSEIKHTASPAQAHKKSLPVAIMPEILPQVTQWAHGCSLSPACWPWLVS